MYKKDIKIEVNKILWERMINKVKMDFKRSYVQTDCLLIVMLLSLYKKNSTERSQDNLYLAIKKPDELSDKNYIDKTIAVYDELLNLMIDSNDKLTYSQVIELAIADYLVLPLSLYTDNISPLYKIIGSKNNTMQKATATAVENMKLKASEMTLIDGCCATGSLFFGLDTYNWKGVTLNDMNPLRTNFLNVLKKEPLKLIKLILDTDLTFINQPDTKNPILSKYKANLKAYKEKRKNYKKVDCNVQIAFEMLIVQCIDKQYVEQKNDIINRTLRFLPASIKLQNATITQKDCLRYLENDTVKKLILLDVPYYCRSSAPKSDRSKSQEDKANIMKMKLGQYFLNKGYYFQKVHLEKDTELMISNVHYSESQFLWNNFSESLL